MKEKCHSWQLTLAAYYRMNLVSGAFPKKILPK